MSKTIPTQTPVTEQAVQVLNEQAAGLQRALSDAGELARQGIAKAQQAGQSMREQVGRASDSTVSYIKEEPVKAVLIAAAAGAAIAALASWLGSRRS
jgi:ElaB/YqjD/DUF883 family membrane-anchored ribosome-binding protein